MACKSFWRTLVLTDDCRCSSSWMDGQKGRQVCLLYLSLGFVGRLLSFIRCLKGQPEEGMESPSSSLPLIDGSDGNSVGGDEKKV